MGPAEAERPIVRTTPRFSFLHVFPSHSLIPSVLPPRSPLLWSKRLPLDACRPVLVPRVAEREPT
ncbi:hypothetical protein Csa_012245 [Cucumis sativus]|uniref:Uncharacterized protein n=1 Tax=Cucumis sativus TaxID=3659 RepID=A0A0A0L0H7_CUCSA|nr:hypothetical protein Csa_012245 [Cucumis sativus]